jgi:hypothetical protein
MKALIKFNVLTRSRHFKNEPRQLPSGSVDPSIVGQLGQDDHDQDGQQAAQQLQHQLLRFAIALGRTQQLRIQKRNLQK